MQGAVGSIFEVENNKDFVLKDGRVFIGAGGNGLKMIVGDDTVELARHTVVLVDGRELKPVRVTVLDSPEPDGAKISKDGTQLATLNTGQEAVIASHDLTDEELIAVDGVEREPIGGLIQKVGMNVRKASVPVKQVMEKEPLLNCCLQIGNGPPLCHISWPYKQLVKKYGPTTAEAELGPAQPRAKAFADPPVQERTSLRLPTSTSPSRKLSARVKRTSPGQRMREAGAPISLNDLTVPAVYRWADNGDLKLVAYTPSIRSNNLRITPGTNVNDIGQNHYRLAEGQVLVQSDSAVSVDTPHGTVLVQPGSAAVVSVDKDLVRVLDLSDKSANDVRLVVGKNSITLRPGQEVAVMSSGVRDVRKLITGDGIGRRRMRILPGGDKLNIVVNDFSVVDALGRHPMLKQLRASRDKRDRDTLSDIMKVAAALSMTLDRTRGPYSAAN